jgi:hypothetical protein
MACPSRNPWVVTVRVLAEALAALTDLSVEAVIVTVLASAQTL